MIIRKYRATCEVADIIHGNINSDELYIHLMMNSDAFAEQMKIEIREEYERLQRESLLKEQHQAYQESLEADRAKEEAKAQKEKMMATERQRQESERAETETRREAIRKEAENSLPIEPMAGSPDVTKIRFRKPTGDFMERRFTVDTKLKVSKNLNPSIEIEFEEKIEFEIKKKVHRLLFNLLNFLINLQILLNFATANGFSSEEFKIISSFPRRDVSSSSVSKSPV